MSFFIKSMKEIVRWPIRNFVQCILFVLFKFSKRFLAVTFLFFAISSLNLHDMRQRFLCSLKRKFSLIRQKLRIFPIDPHCKIRSLWQRDVTKMDNFYNGGLRGKPMSFVGSNWHFVFDYKKNLETYRVSFT